MVDQIQDQNFISSVHLIEEFPRINSQSQAFQPTWCPSHDLCQPSYTHQQTQYSHSHNAYQRSPNHSQKHRLKQRINQRKRSRPRQSPNSNRSNRTSDSVSQVQLPTTYTLPMDVPFMVDYLQKTNYHENPTFFLHEIGHDLNVQSLFHPQSTNNFMINNNDQSFYENQPLLDLNSISPPDMLGHNQIGMPSNIDLYLMENQFNPATTLDYVQNNDYVDTIPMNINTSSDFLLYPPNHGVFPDAPITASSH
ncbi:12674_t:CDS:1, partial [Cetraspora pellucida]